MSTQEQSTKFGENKFEENQRRQYLRFKKQHVYNKVIQFNDKLARGEGIPIIQFQYDYTCNFLCEHCSIEKFKMTRKEERESHRRYFKHDDIRELARQADEMGISTFVITGGEPLIFKDFDDIVKAIDPEKFWIVTDTNGWYLNYERAVHLKEMGVDKVQLSLDGVDAETHDSFRRKKGSFKRVIGAIEACKKADLHVILSTVVWRDRVKSEEFQQFLEMAKAYKVGTYVTYVKPVGAYEGRFDQILTPEDEAMVRDLEKKYDIFTHMTPSYGMDIGCIAVKRILSITRYGDVMPCPYIHISLGNLFEESLKEIVDRGLNVHWFDPHVKMPCLCGVDRTFIDKVLIHTYGNVDVPVHYSKIFNKEDFVDPAKEKLFAHDPDVQARKQELAQPEGDVRLIRVVETANGMIPITWAPLEDTFYAHKLEGEPEAAKQYDGTFWNAPSNIKFLEKEGEKNK
jgi:MoaA/NifB/PqqE/SkfB family radical SAM enzyme